MSCANAEQPRLQLRARRRPASRQRSTSADAAAVAVTSLSCARHTSPGDKYFYSFKYFPILLLLLLLLCYAFLTSASSCGFPFESILSSHLMFCPLLLTLLSEAISADSFAFKHNMPELLNKLRFSISHSYNLFKFFVLFWILLHLFPKNKKFNFKADNKLHFAFKILRIDARYIRTFELCKMYYCPSIYVL